MRFSNSPAAPVGAQDVLRDVPAILLEYYDLPTPAAFLQFSTGHFHLTYCAVAADTRYIVRISRLRNYPQVEAELSVVKALGRTAFRDRAPTVVMTRTGRTCVHTQRGIYTVFDFSAGHLYRFEPPIVRKDLKFARAAVTTLLDLHRAFDSIGTAEQGAVETQAAAIRRMIDVVLSGTTAISRSPLARLILQHSQFLSDAANDVEGELAKNAGLFRLIHGDFTFRNLLWRRDHSLVVLDYDETKLGNRWFDMVKLIDRLFITTGDVAGEISQRYEMATDCLTHYWAACSADERSRLRCGTSALFAALRYTCFQELWAVLLIDELSDARKFDIIRRDIEVLQATYVQREMAPLAEIWERVLARD